MSMINCLICGESVPQKDFAGHIQRHAGELVEKMGALPVSDAWTEAVRLVDGMDALCDEQRHKSKLVRHAINYGRSPYSFWAYQKAKTAKLPSLDEMTKPEPAPIDLNEVIPYRIEARQEHERLMAAHRLRGELNEANLRIDVMQKLENLMEGFCGLRLDYAPLGEPPKPKEG